MVRGEPLPNLGSDGAIKYLGVSYSARGVVKDAGIKITQQLKELRQAPLKPHQRLTMLREHVIPGAMHALVLGDVRKATLRRTDQTIRAAVREFLHLPKDTPSAYLHAHPTDGGLGIPELGAIVPLQRLQRLEKLEGSEYPPVQRLVSSEVFRKMKERCRPVHATKDAIRREHRRQLLEKIDGAGLREAPNHPPSHRWVTAPNPPMPGSAFVGCLQVRGNLAATGQRAARTRRNPGVAPCDAGCGRPETLGHISQVCTRTHPNRVARHDGAVNQLEGIFRNAGATTIKEPAIPTPAGIRRPDLLVATEDSAVVIDVQVVADHADLAAANRRKIQYYDNEAIKNTAQEKLATRRPVRVEAATLNWRGCWAKDSVVGLKALGLTDHQLAQISIRVLEGTYHILKIFRKTGSQGRGWARPGRRTQRMTDHPS